MVGFPKGVKIFGKVYTLKDLQMIGQEKVEDDLLEWRYEDLDYICDNSEVRYYEVYRWRFKNKKTYADVDIYVTYYPDKDTIRFNGEKKKEFIHYLNNQKPKDLDKWKKAEEKYNFIFRIP